MYSNSHKAVSGRHARGRRSGCIGIGSVRCSEDSVDFVDGSSDGKPAVMDISWRSVIDPSSAVRYFWYRGSSSSRVASSPLMIFSSMAMPMSAETTLLVTDQTCNASSGLLPFR